MKSAIKIFEGPKEIEALVELLHDEYFEVEEVRFDSQAGVVELPFRRVFHDRPPRLISNWLIFRTYEHEVLRCVVRINNVKDLQIIEQAKLGSYSFNEVQLNEKDGELVIECCEPCQIRMKISKFSAEYEEIGCQGKTKVHWLGFIEFASGRVHE